jgi:hypothetical protein
VKAAGFNALTGPTAGLGALLVEQVQAVGVDGQRRVIPFAIAAFLAQTQEQLAALDLHLKELIGTDWQHRGHAPAQGGVSHRRRVLHHVFGAQAQHHIAPALALHLEGRLRWQRHPQAASLDGHTRPQIDQLALDEIDRRIAQKGGHEHVARALVDFVGRRSAAPPPRITDAIGQCQRLGLIVGHVDKCGLHGLVQLLDLGAHGDAQGRVEVGQGLIHQEHMRLSHHGATQRHALALAARKLVRPTLQQRLDFETARGIAHAAVDFVLGVLAHPQAKGDVLVDRFVRVERIALEHHGDVALVRRHGVHHRVVEHQVSIGHVLQARDHVQGGGFATA